MPPPLGSHREHPTAADGVPGVPAFPSTRPLVQKRPHRRGPYACDECRLRKRACDAKQPCGPCRRSETDCTYAFRQPVSRPTARIRALQDQLQQARGWLQRIQSANPAGINLPGLDLNRCLEALGASIQDGSPPGSLSTSPIQSPRVPRKGPPGKLLTGDQLVGDDGESTSLYGACSDVSFISMSIDLLEKKAPASRKTRLSRISDLLCRPLQTQGWDSIEYVGIGAIPDDVTHLSRIVLERDDLMLCFLPKDEIDALVNSADASCASKSRLALVHMVVALGYIYDPATHKGGGCEEAIRHAIRHFEHGMILNQSAMMQDLTSLAALLCGIMFLLSTYRTPMAYTLIGTACSTAVRLGLCSSQTRPDDALPRVRKLRRRLLASTLSIDRLGSLILDFPTSLYHEVLSEAEIMRLISEAEAEDDLATSALLRQATLLHIPLSYQGRDSLGHDPEEAQITGLHKAQEACQLWKKDAAVFLSRLEKDPKYHGIRHDMEMAFSLVQIIMLRPHLYHVRDMYMGKIVSVAESHYALACIKIASSTILTAEAAHRDSLLSIYTTFSSVVCLAFLVAAHPATTMPSIAWQRACRGTRLIAENRCFDNAASICLELLKLITSSLKETIYIDFESIEAASPRVCQKGNDKEDNTGTDLRQNDNLDETLRITQVRDRGINVADCHDINEYWDQVVLNLEDAEEGVPDRVGAFTQGTDLMDIPDSDHHDQ